MRHHLLMTHTAFRRDLEDEKTIFDFAKTMGNVNNLKMLYLLTFADVKAVGPEVWNPWKASLLGELYVKTLNLLEEVEKGEFQRQDVRAVMRRVQTRVRRQLKESHDDEKVESFMETMPERYFLSTPESDIPGHFELMDKFRGKKAEISVQHFPERDCTSVVICSQDRPGLFASITGVLTALQLRHSQRAHLYRQRRPHSRRLSDFASWPLRDGHGGAEMESKFRVAAGRSSRRQDRCRQAGGIVQAVILSAKARAQGLHRGQYRQRSVGRFHRSSRYLPKIASACCSRITYSLHRLGLSIHVAKISTNVDQVADVFYVTDKPALN